HGPAPPGRLKIGKVFRGGEEMNIRFATPLASSLMAIAFGGGVLAPAQAQEPTSIKVGWAISKTGPNVAGATITLLNAYKLWVKDVNAAGGIMPKSTKKKPRVEVTEYDARSNWEEMIKAVGRLISQDKVVFVSPPWGTAFSVASAPIFARAGYPQILVTAT